MLYLKGYLKGQVCALLHRPPYLGIEPQDIQMDQWESLFRKQFREAFQLPRADIIATVDRKNSVINTHSGAKDYAIHTFSYWMMERADEFRWTESKDDTNEAIPIWTTKQELSEEHKQIAATG